MEAAKGRMEWYIVTMSKNSLSPDGTLTIKKIVEVVGLPLDGIKNCSAVNMHRPQNSGQETYEMMVPALFLYLILFLD